MCHQQQCTVIALQRLFELFDGGEIEMVCRLIENQHVGAASLKQRKAGAGALPGRQFLDCTFDMVGAQPEFGEQGAHIGGRPGRHPLLETVDESPGTREVGTGLVDLANGDTGAQACPALVWL